MTSPDFEQARQYALERLNQDLPAALVYHSLEHTRDDVVPAVERLAALEGIEGEPLMLLLTAAFYHDLGFIEQYNDHERVSVRIARAMLPQFGYSEAQIEAISGMIMATKLPQSPQNHLEKILADADLDNLGRDDFLERSQALRDEFDALDMGVNDEDWYERQLQFLQKHRYFTAAAQQLREANKQQHLKELIEGGDRHG